MYNKYSTTHFYEQGFVKKMAQMKYKVHLVAILLYPWEKDEQYHKIEVFPDSLKTHYN